MSEDELIDEMAMEMFPTAWADHDDPQDDGQISKKYARFKARAALAAIRKAGCVIVPSNIRRAFYYAIEMPVTKDGQGPATVGVDAEQITYEVWDQLLASHGSHNNLPDAINQANALNDRDISYASPLKGET